jgi:pimeloyl-ACP methyl ester carboxylesterase
MAQAVVEFGKSTTGRSLNLEWRRLQLLVGASISSNLAERTAARLFATPERSARPEHENQLLARSRPFRVHGLAAWRWGSGPPVLLVHDWDGRGAQLGAFVSPLVARGFSVVAFDAPAHGSSPGLRAGVRDFADGILALRDRIGAPRAIVAHSFGALGALLAVRRGVETKALALLAPPSPVDRLISFRNELDLSDELFPAVRRRIERRAGAALDDLESIILARELTTPALIVHDRHDDEASWRIGSELSRAWPGATLHTTEGLGHHRILFDPGVVDRVAQFVAAGV